MMDNTKETGITRRDFLRGAVGASLIGAAGIPLIVGNTSSIETSEYKKSRVVLIRDANVIDENSNINAAVMQRMLDHAVTVLFDEIDPLMAWKRVVNPEDTVGIKSNVWRFLPTPVELERAIMKRLIDVGVPENRIGIDDRGVLRNKLFKKATALINVRPLRTHHWSGVGGCIKNYIMFSPAPYEYHPDACADLAKLYSLPRIKGKSRLHILVMLTPLYHGKGPHHFQKRYTWQYKGLLVSQDPVAVDATGVRILMAKRLEVFGRGQDLLVSPKHIRTAEEKFNLGVANPDKIEIIKLGWKKGILI